MLPKRNEITHQTSNQVYSEKRNLSEQPIRSNKENTSTQTSEQEHTEEKIKPELIDIKYYQNIMDCKWGDLC
jgi:hypothetical protein